MEKELKSVLFSYIVNPGAGISSLSGNFAVNMVFSNVPVRIVGCELVDVLVSDNTGTVTYGIEYLKLNTFYSPGRQIRDLISFSPMSGAVVSGVVQPLFIYKGNFVGEAIRMLNFRVLPSDSFSFGFSARFQPLSNATDSFILNARLYWVEEPDN